MSFSSFTTKLNFFSEAESVIAERDVSWLNFQLLKFLISCSGAENLAAKQESKQHVRDVYEWVLFWAEGEEEKKISPDVLKCEAQMKDESLRERNTPVPIIHWNE